MSRLSRRRQDEVEEWRERPDEVISSGPEPLPSDETGSRWRSQEGWARDIDRMT